MIVSDEASVKERHMHLLATYDSLLQQRLLGSTEERRHCLLLSVDQLQSSIKPEDSKHEIWATWK